LAARKVSSKKKGTKKAAESVDPKMYRMLSGTVPSRISRNIALRGVVPLSECAAKYAIAVTDPWNPKAIGSCVPAGNPRPSMKVNTLTRFTMTVGTNGTGFVLLMPCLAKDSTCVVYTNGVGATSYQGSGATLNWLNTGPALATGVALLSNSVLPFATNELFQEYSEVGESQGVNGRIISLGVSATFAGTAMNTGGTMTILTRSSHQSVVQSTGVPGTFPNEISVPYLQQFREARVHPVHPIKYTVVDSARLDGEEDYSSNTIREQSSQEQYDQQNVLYPFSQGSITSTTTSTTWAGIGSPTSIILVQGGVPGSSFICELCGHFEFNGPLAQYGLSPVHVDPVGFGMVREAAAQLPSMQAGAPDTSPTTLMLSTLRTAAEHIGPAAVRAGGAMLQAALGGGSRGAIAAAGAYGLLGN